MVKPARSSPKKDPPSKVTRVADERPIKRVLPRSGERGNMDHAIRTVLYVEVQDYPANDASAFIKKLVATLPNEHPHYVVPMRFGKLTTDFEFEGEFLETVKKLCEVKDGEIVLKDGTQEVDVIRRKV